MPRINKLHKNTMESSAPVPNNNNDNFITIKQAAELIGKTEHTISKLLAQRKIARAGKRGNKTLVDKNELLQHYSITDNNLDKIIDTTNNKYIDFLQKELNIAHVSIEKLHELIHESNINQANLQSKIPLIDAPTSGENNKSDTDIDSDKKSPFWRFW